MHTYEAVQIYPLLSALIPPVLAQLLDLRHSRVVPKAPIPTRNTIDHYCTTPCTDGQVAFISTDKLGLRSTNPTFPCLSPLLVGHPSTILHPPSINPPPNPTSRHLRHHTARFSSAGPPTSDIHSVLCETPPKASQSKRQGAVIHLLVRQSILSNHTSDSFPLN